MTNAMMLKAILFPLMGTVQKNDQEVKRFLVIFQLINERCEFSLTAKTRGLGGGPGGATAGFWIGNH